MRKVGGDNEEGLFFSLGPSAQKGRRARSGEEGVGHKNRPSAQTMGTFRA